MSQPSPNWHGFPREKISWYPTVNMDKCTGCGVCFTGCGRKVFSFDFDNKKALVNQPTACMVGCVTCMNTCLFDAITFPAIEELRDFMKKEKILVNAKKELEAAQA